MKNAEGAFKSRLWQQAMIRAARSKRVSRFMQANPLARKLARRYVGGVDRIEVLERLDGLARKGLVASLYFLGEYVDTPELVEHNVSEIVEALRACGSVAPSVFFSIDPTQIGFSISDALGRSSALRIGMESRMHPGVRFVMLDMEDASYVERTIALYLALRDRGIPAAITLQAYLRRTEDDFERLASQGARIRLVKGAFVGQKEIAWTRKREIDGAYERLAWCALSSKMKTAGVYPVFATHDACILNALKPVLRASGWRSHEYEIEMLLGVREPLQLTLVQEGYPVRVYLPFGTEWWAYSARRVAENPANVRFLLQAFWGR